VSAPDADVDYYDIYMREAEIPVLPGPPTRMFTYNGMYPGPTIVATRNRPVSVTQHNGLAVNTSIHNHGAYVGGDSDGHPADAIAPGKSKPYFYPNAVETAPDDVTSHLQWYHDHVEHATSTNVYRGLAGLYLFVDPNEAALGLPSDGADISLVIQDRLFNADNSLNYPFPANDSDNGVLGDVILVNGAPQPYLKVERRKYRLRFLNGCPARNLELSLGSGVPLQVIAAEAGLLEHPVSVSSLFIAPAERYEVIVDFARYPKGSSLVLKNLQGGTRTKDVMRFDVTWDAVDTSTVPDRLRTIPRILEADATMRRRFVFERTNGQWVINGKTFDRRRIDATPRVGDTEIWTLANNSGGWLHPVHIHLLNFQVLDRNGRPPAPQESGWKETVKVGPNEVVRVIMKWPVVPLNNGIVGQYPATYVFHCHNLEHEDHDMMMQFKVVT
jgi:FtsP/CotA-like multicopper oxidase with cupredoxin domain